MNLKQWVLMLGVGAAMVATQTVAAEIPASLRGGHRIVFLGDSITQHGDYVTDVDCWLVANGIPIEVLNLGLASETAADLTEAENAGHQKSFGFGRPFLSERLARVLAATRPDVVIACYGMNDGSNLPADESGTKRYAAAITQLRDAALQAGVKRVVLCTPPPHDAKGNPATAAHDANLTRYSAWLLSKRAAGWDVVDIHGPMRRALEAGRASDPNFALAQDGVHPGREGHWLMATAILEQFLGADLAGVGGAEQLFKTNGKEIRDLVQKRMKLRFATWMANIRHTRPGVPGGPGTKPGPVLEVTNEQAAQLTRQITELLSGPRDDSARPTPRVQREYHVSGTGNDANDGGTSNHLRTISAAALRAHPGDVITVHAGVYRERINPPRGGESDALRIVYQAAAGELVEIKGSEVVTNWVKLQDDVWRVTLPNSLFGNFNPYRDLIHGDWFNSKGRTHHTGAVYLNGTWLMEAAKLEDVLKVAGTNSYWFGQVDQEQTRIWAQFKGVDPNEQLVEINVRQTVFYPEQPGRNYITVRGFTLRHAATPWAPPTAEQLGLIGTHWSKGWIIESNVISHSRCSGISLGKHGDEFDNTSANTAEGYVKTIERGLQRGWNKATIGQHLVRNNEISHCEQTGIVGSMGCAFSTVTGNRIHDIHVQQLFSGAEMAGIKFHGAIDVEISGNHIYRASLGLWLDWMAQGTRVTRNLFNNNGRDLFLEVNHGPYLVDNNLFLSRGRFDVQSDGGAFVHNLFAGELLARAESGRLTPYHEAHSTKVAGLRRTAIGDVRFYHNLFIGPANLSGYDAATLPVWMAGNVFLKGSNPSKHEIRPLLSPDSDPQLKLVETPDGFDLEGIFDQAWSGGPRRQLVTTELLGRAVIPDLPFERADGSPIRITTDFLGRPRDQANPFPGPFELRKSGLQRFKVWPLTNY
jgi:alpha-N-arabinofuranosidase